MSDFHLGRQADCTLALKPMKDFDRYGVVKQTMKGTYAHSGKSNIMQVD
ncbi:MAG: hypothetical protein U0T56_06965 [Ferruginibacter sp.]